MNPEPRTAADGTNLGGASGGGPGWIPLYAAPACRLRAAGHLQGPAKHVTTDTDHLLSLVSRTVPARQADPEALRGEGHSSDSSASSTAGSSAGTGSGVAPLPSGPCP